MKSRCLIGIHYWKNYKKKLKYKIGNRSFESNGEFRSCLGCDKNQRRVSYVRSLGGNWVDLENGPKGIEGPKGIDFPNILNVLNPIKLDQNTIESLNKYTGSWINFIKNKIVNWFKSSDPPIKSKMGKIPKKVKLN